MLTSLSDNAMRGIGSQST